MQRDRAALAKQYEKLTPKERLALVLEARARGDDAEVRRLWDTCPRKMYTSHDARFEDSYDAITKIVLSTCIDLASALAKARMVVACSVMLAPLIQLASVEEAHATMLEIYSEQRGEGDETGAEPPDGVEEDRDGGDEEDTEPKPTEFKPLTPEAYCEQHLPKTLERAQRVVDECFGKFAATPAGILAGLDRFTQRVLGMDAKSVLKAFMPVIVADIEDLKVDEVAADETLAAEVEETIMKGWRRFVFGEGT
jgi:hypothetical protein